MLKENVFNKKIIEAGDMSSNLESEVIDTSRLSSIVFYAKWTGSPVGNIKLQVSIDNVNFVDLPSSQQAVSGADDFMWNVTDTNYDQIKIVYTATSGSGTLEVQANAKGKGI